jgi:hypothetical protein
MDITVSQSPIYVEYFQDLSATTDVPGATPALAPTLEQNYPNPFRPTTTIRYTVPGETGQSQDIRLTVYDVGGRAVRHLVSGTQSAGAHDAYWSGEDDEGKPVPPGIYLYRLESGSFRETRKMILSR